MSVWNMIGRAAAVGAWLSAGLVGTARAQQRPHPLAGRLDSATVVTIERLIDSVSALGVPSEPLVAKALEGATKRANPAVIVQTVRRLAAALSAARTALGAGAGADELVAGANVLRAGISAAGLRALRQTRRASVTVPLVVLGDLLARGVPADKGLALIAAACRQGVADQDLLLVRDQVRADIQAGAGPAAAAQLRIQGVLGGARPYQSPLQLRPSATVMFASGVGTQFQPALLLQRGAARLRAEGFASVASVDESVLRYRGVQADAEARLSLRHALAAVVAVQASHGDPAWGPSQGVLDGAARLRREGGGGGVSAWIGAGTRRVASAGRVGWGSYAGGGASRRIGAVGLEVEVEHGTLPLMGFSVTTPVVDTFPPPPPARSSVYAAPLGGTTARVTLALGGGRGVIDLSGGVTEGAGTLARRWGQATAVVRLTPLVALLAGAGTRGPEDFRESRVGARFARFGVRLESPAPLVLPRAAPPAAPPAGEVRAELQLRGDGVQAFRVWAPAAGTVEVAGDMTGWIPAALTRDSSGWWSLELTLAPGLYQLSMRIDRGAWLPPPGLATTEDGYGGQVGVVVVN